MAISTNHVLITTFIPFEQVLKFNRDCEGVFLYTSHFKGMILLWVNREIHELFKYKHYLGNILTICRVSMVVGRGKGCLCQCNCNLRSGVPIFFLPREGTAKKYRDGWSQVSAWYMFPLSNLHLVKFQPSRADKCKICLNDSAITE